MVVPVFYGTYTALGLVNTIIYLDELGNYPPWAIALVFVGIAVLIYGVYLLSSKPDPAHLTEEREPEQDSIVNWLSAKDEKEAVATTITIGESSTCSQENSNFSKLFKKLSRTNDTTIPLTVSK